jgi:hypothetical protein
MRLEMADDLMNRFAQHIKTVLLCLALVVGADYAWAENYRVPSAMERQVSSILGEDIVATQRLPRDMSMQVLQQGGVPFVRFTIADGDIGGAPTDNNATHNRIFDRPYSERAEIRTDGTLRRNSMYEVEFEVRFVEGFFGDNETFFQVHTGQKPPAMLFFRQFGRTHLLANLMQGCSRTCGNNDQPEYSKVKSFFPRSQMFGRWHEVRIRMDTSNQGSMSMWFNGSLFMTNEPVTIPTQHRPYLRFGVYRSGSNDGNETSIVDYRGLSIIRVGASG